MTLTDMQIKKANKGEKIITLSDGGGLQLWIMPIGSKLWHLAYRDSQGKQKKLAFGAYPTVGLADARKKRDEAKALLVSGIDPSQQRKLDKITKAISDAATFDAVAEEYLAKKVREGMAASLRSQLRLVSPVFGNRPIAEITVPEVLAPLKKYARRAHAAGLLHQLSPPGDAGWPIRQSCAVSLGSLAASDAATDQQHCICQHPIAHPAKADASPANFLASGRHPFEAHEPLA
jgi:Arm DNA-binding domain